MESAKDANQQPENATETTTVSVTAAGSSLGDLINRVSYGGETIVLTRRNKPVAKLVPMKQKAVA